MKKEVSDLYTRDLKLSADYVRDVLKLTDERAELVGRISGGIHREESEFLARQVGAAQPTVSLEVGLGYGFSALTICANSKTGPGRRHIVIDPHQTRHWGGKGLAHLREAGFETMVELHEEPSYRALPKLELSGLSVDLAFIDGWHTFDFVFVDVFFIDKMLREGGLIIFDDADWPSIRPVLRYMVTNLGYQVAGTMPQKRALEPLDVELGLEGSCIALRKAAAPAREIFFHKPFS